MATRKIFVSYHHKGDQSTYRRFARDYSDDLDVFDDHSVERKADSTNVTYLARVCRERITGTSVTVVLIGRNTGGRRFVDWEIIDTLNKEHGLVGILAPDVPREQAWLPPRLQDNIRSGYAKCYGYPTSAAAVYELIDEAFRAPNSLIRNTRDRSINNRAQPSS